MKKCIIFGSKYLGNVLYYKLKNLYQIVAYTDNDSTLWSQCLNGIKVVPVHEINTLMPAEVFIATINYEETADQLDQMGINNYILFKDGFLYHYNSVRLILPLHLPKQPYYRKNNPSEYSALFVQTTDSAHTHQVASALKRHDVHVSLAYTLEHPSIANFEFSSAYDSILAVNTMEELVDYVDNSEFDIIHSVNAPEYLTLLLVFTNKKTVLGTSALSSICNSVSPEILVEEYISQVKANGIVYPSKKVKEAAIQKFSLPEEKIFVLEDSSKISEEKINDLIEFYRRR